MPDHLRPLGTTDIRVSPVAMGCWPIAGMTSLNVTDADSRATLLAAVDAGVNFFDTAYCYGATGESERLIAEVLSDRRDEIVIATKGGIHFDESLQRQIDARPQTLRRQCEESLSRLGVDEVELYYLHAPDPKVPVAESAGELQRLLDEGKVRSIGASNCTIAQLEEFLTACPLAAYQPPYNLLQRDIEAELVPWCVERDISIIPYWPLMKGFLAGKLPRDHTFAPGDGRAKYPMFQGEEWERNHDFLDELRAIADETGRTIAQVTVNWTIHQPGITSALCGAKRADQIAETAAAMGWQLSDEHRRRIDEALAKRGEPVSRWAV